MLLCATSSCAGASSKCVVGQLLDPGAHSMSVNFGDFITLSSDGGYMHAQALVLTRLGVRYANGGELPSRFHEHIFRICPALRYEAQDSERARRTLARSNSMSVKETKELAEAEVVERTKNAAVLAQLDAAPTSNLYYGSTIQLLHVYSGKFISGKRATAEVQKENLLLTLEQQGSSDSAFIVKPRCDPLPSARATHGGGSPSQDPASRSVSPFSTRALACPPLVRPSHLHTHAPCVPLRAYASNALACVVPCVATITAQKGTTSTSTTRSCSRASRSRRRASAPRPPRSTTSSPTCARSASSSSRPAGRSVASRG